MKKRNIQTAILASALLFLQTTALTAETPSTKNTAKPLILAIDNQNIEGHFARIDTYTSQFYNQGVSTSSPSEIRSSQISKTLNKLGNAFKRITSIKYGKSKKIRAKLSPSSLTLRYTHRL